MADKKKKSKKKSTGIGFAIWLIVAVILVIVFMTNWTTIHNNLVKAGILDGKIIEQEEKPVVEKPKKTESAKKKETVTLKVQEEDKPAPKVEIKKPETKPAETAAEKPAEKTETKAETKPAEKTEEAKTETKPAEKPAEAKPVATTSVKLCFVSIDAEGSVNYKMVSRSVPKDSPLTSAINQLLQGPSFTNSAEKNCTTLIPNGTKLLGASVKDGVATLNFNDAFEINTEGVEGYLAQMNQVINTATEFSNIKSVQFLINGKKKEYLGNEGIWIGSPLGKGSL